MKLTDDELIQKLTERFAQGRKLFSDLVVVNRKLVEMNRRLELSESLTSNFLSNIRNEINNPLSVITGLAGQLSDRLTGMGQAGEGLSDLASMICSEAHVLDFQLQNIFIAADLEAGAVDPHIARANVAAVVGYVVDSFRHDAARKSVEIELALSPSDEPLLFATDAEKLQVIASNLLANALEYSQEKGEVTVSMGVDLEGRLVLTVQDCGPGIAAKDLGRIFDRFVQLETGTTRPHAGHGLGLSITKALTDLLQGTLTVESEPGKGSLFTVKLPPTSIADDENTFAEGGHLFIFDELSEK